jgi:hypothetical protein
MTRRPGALLAALLLPALALAGCASAAAAPAPAGQVPSAARVVTLALSQPKAASLPAAEPAPVTVTNPARVRAIAALLDGLTAIPSGAVYSCPADSGGLLTLTFRASAAGPVLAVVAAQLTGCGFVGVTVDGKQQPELGPGDSGRALAARALKDAGLNWKLPGF